VQKEKNKLEVGFYYISLREIKRVNENISSRENSIDRDMKRLREDI